MRRYFTINLLLWSLLLVCQVARADGVTHVALNETFDVNNGTGGRDGAYSDQIASSGVAYVQEGWTNSNSVYGGSACLRFGTSNNNGTCTTPEIILIGATKTATLTFNAAGWGDSNSNTLTVSANDGVTTNVTLVNRILHRDGHWNTLCVPFDQFLMDDSPLQGADVRELTSATMSDDTLNLTFTAKDVVYQIEAGKPYILRWNDTVKEDLVSPTFRSVTISDSAAYVDFTNGHFQGSFSANTFAADTSIYLLGQGDTIYRPQVQTILGACRAYFLLTDGAPAPARVVIHFEGSGTDGLDPETQEALEPKKILKNGVLYIRREGVVYDALGKRVK